MLEVVLGPRFLPLGTAGICAPIERLEDGAGNRFGMGVPFVAARRFGYGTVAFVQVIAERKISNDGAARFSTELKTNESYRVNELDDETFDLLMRYRATLNSSKDDDFIFPSPQNHRAPLSKTEFRRRFYRLTEEAGLPRIAPTG